MSNADAQQQQCTKAITRYLSSAINRFYVTMWRTQRDLGEESSSFFSSGILNPIGRFQAELRKVGRYSTNNIHKCTTSIMQDIQSQYPYFTFHTQLSLITSSIICLYSNDPSSACGSQIMIDDDQILEFIYECLVAISGDLIQIPSVFKKSFEDRETLLDFVYSRNISNCIMDFVFRYKKRLSAQQSQMYEPPQLEDPMHEYYRNQQQQELRQQQEQPQMYQGLEQQQQQQQQMQPQQQQMQPEEDYSKYFS